MQGVPTGRERLFELVCKRDLEDIVAKHRQSRYVVADRNPALGEDQERKDFPS